MTHDAEDVGGRAFGRLRTVVLVLFLCSGMSSLIYEVVWTRLLTVILGNTVFAVSAVLTVFMGGLALGSFVGGRDIDRRRAPLRVYALLEIAIGLSGFGVTSILNQTGSVYVAIHTGLSEYPTLLLGARYVFTFCLLAVPTTLMGATLPALSRFVVERQEGLGLDLGRLYAVNTFGAAVGCYLAGFVLIGNVGARATVTLASAISIAVGLVAWYSDRLATRERPKARALPVASQGGERSWSPLRLLILAAFGITGFTALGYEVVWTRILVSYLGNSVYAFCTMLTAFLTGIALGSLCLSQIVDRDRRLVTSFGLIHAAVGFYVLFLIYVFSWRLELLAAIRKPSPIWDASGPGFFKAFALMLVPTFLFGAAFPVASRIYINNFPRLGRSLGELYAWNTVGAILGAAVAGFALMPCLGLEYSLAFLLCLNLCVGAALCGSDPAVVRNQRFLLPGALAAAAGIGLLGMPRDVFRQMHEVASHRDELVYYKEDLMGTVTVRQQGHHRRLLIDSLDVAGTTDDFISSHKSLGHLPMLLHPNPRVAYVLGFGAGGTAYAMTTYPEVERIDATELSRGVVEVAPLFERINHNVTSDPRLHLEVNDGRHFLLTTRQTYDVVSVDLLWPHTAGSGSLYTKEFYQLCRRRMNDRGLMVEWLQPGFIPPEHLKMILGTVRQVFSYTSLWWTRQQNHLLVVASKTPLRIDYQRLTLRMNGPSTRRDLQEWQLADPAAFVSYFIADGDALARFVGEPNLLNTDDLPLVEYQLPLQSRFVRLENLTGLSRIQQSVLPLLERVDGEQKERILLYERSNRRLQDAYIAFFEGRLDDAKAECREILEGNPEHPDARDLIRAINEIIARSSGL